MKIRQKYVILFHTSAMQYRLLFPAICFPPCFHHDRGSVGGFATDLGEPGDLVMSRCMCVDRRPVGNFELTPSELIVGWNVRGPRERKREGARAFGKRKKKEGDKG